ncbi:hypothetical protein J7M23_11715, partial [Candidatus Sumerlaeota bacterium]|nr:hypothetical protein [Candidatus Sumerlaeota bacterium]
YKNEALFDNSDGENVRDIRHSPHLGVLTDDLPPEVLDESGKFINLNSYCSILLCAIKDLKSKVDTQEEMIKQLQERISELEKQINTEK